MKHYEVVYYLVLENESLNDTLVPLGIGTKLDFRRSQGANYGKSKRGSAKGEGSSPC